MVVAAFELLAFVVGVAELPVQLALLQPGAVHLLSPVDRNVVCQAPRHAPDQHHQKFPVGLEHQRVTDCAPGQNYLCCFSPTSVTS